MNMVHIYNDLTVHFVIVVLVVDCSLILDSSLVVDCSFVVDYTVAEVEVVAHIVGIVVADNIGEVVVVVQEQRWRP